MGPFLSLGDCICKDQRRAHGCIPGVHEDAQTYVNIGAQLLLASKCVGLGLNP